jgi:hypothetical protein
MMNKNGILLIGFAWAMEIVGVTGGIINSAYTTFGDELPATLPGYLPAVPMLALAVAELGRVPLASVIYQKRKIMQLVAIVGILSLGYLAVEGWAFGFERIVDLRVKTVVKANGELSRAEADLFRLLQKREQIVANNNQKRDELRRGIKQRDSSIDELTTQLSKEAEIHQRNLDGIREACRLIRGACMVPRSQVEDKRYAVEADRLSAELASQREQRKRLQSDIDNLVKTDASGAAELAQEIEIAASSVNEARQASRNAKDGNQIYRLAASWYGVSTTDVTDKQFATARGIFTTFSAVAVALAGTIAALVYYASSRVPGSPLFTGMLMTKMVRARRAFYARKRRPLKVEVPGPERPVYVDGKEPPVVVEKEVLRFIDRIVLIPRWGVRVPTYINSLFGDGERTSAVHAKSDDVAESASNVTSLNRKAG